MQIGRLFLPSFVLLATAVPLAVVGCNAKVATVLETDDASASPVGAGSNDAAPTPTGTSTSAPTPLCVAKGGQCLAPGIAPKAPGYGKGPDGLCTGTDVCWLPTTPPTAICTADQNCNSDPSMSSLSGSCFGGICICASGYFVQKDGKCAKTPPPDCMAQGGKCHQQPATCPAKSDLQGNNEENMSCGDFIAAVCCFAEAACRGPVKSAAGGGSTPIDMVCCGPAGGLTDPVCVNGWRSCQPGTTPIDKSVGGCT